VIVLTPEVVLASAVVGFLIGAIGIGGILLIPALAALANLTPHQASATALFTFLFTGILGTILFQRKGSIDWRQAATVCAGAIVFSYLGARASALVSGPVLMRVIALLIVFAGAYVFFPAKPRPAGTAEGPRTGALLLIGAASGFGSGFSGAGGPLFSVPLMVIGGFPALTAIGTSQVLQVWSAGAGSFAHLATGAIQWPLVTGIVAGELVGVFAGVWLAHAVSALVLRRLAGSACLVVGAWLLVKHFQP
jgi:uncharacterized membrane protein YfcA